jgi:hypothetical protein
MAISVRLTLNPNGVVAPALTSLRNTLEVVSICFPAIDSANAVPPLGSGMELVFEPKAANMEERRPVYKQWLLSKGFHELAKGVRQSLEEAYLYLEIPKNEGVTTWGGLQTHISGIKKKANDADFPKLMGLVNEGLTEKLHFETEFLSLNKTRNCLEHRQGVVGQRDVDHNAGVLTLSLPRMKIFFMEDGTETELATGQVFEKDTEILVKRVTDQRTYKLGDKISFSIDEFKAIGFACLLFAQDLGSKLPKLPSHAAGAT